MMMRETCAFHCGILHVSRFVAWMLAGLVVMTAQWAQAKAYRDGNGLTWYYKEVNDDSAIIMNDGDNTMFSAAIDPATAVGEVVVPEKIYDLQVVGLGAYALNGCTKMTSARIPEAVKTIDYHAFYRCTSVTNIVVPKNVTEIGGQAFYECSKLPDLTVPASVKTVGASAFYSCTSLTNVTFEARAESLSIGQSAFESCSALVHVTLGSVRGTLLIGNEAFERCQRLQAFDFPADARLEAIGVSAFYGCTSLSGEFVIPAAVTNIGQTAFYNCESLASIRFVEPANSARVPMTVGKSAFFGCSSVTNLYLSQKVANIEEAAFQGMSALSEVSLPANLTALADSLFVDCASLTRIDLPTNALQAIGSQAFYYSTNLLEFTIPASVETVGSGAFRSTGFWLRWPADSPFVVKDGWLLGVKGTCPGDVVLTNVQHVADGAFANAQTLTNLVIAGTVQTVGANAFKGCTNLMAVSISPDVQLDGTAFNDSNWLPTGDGEGEFIDPTLPVVHYSVVFNANGGAGNMATQTFRVGVAKALSLNQFTRPLHEFAGWANVSTGRVVYADGQVVSNLTLKANGVVSLYARWNLLTNQLYTVAFRANGGTGTMSNQTFAVGQGQTLNTNRFTRSGFEFLGWGLASTGTVAYADGEFVENLSTNNGVTVSLYALWRMLGGEIKTEQVGGCVWHYMVVSSNSAMIVNNVDGQFVSAVEAPGITSLVVPETLGGVQVTAVGEKAFVGCSDMTSIVLPATVTSIGANAFAGCSRLVSVTMPVPSPLYEIMPDSYRKIRQVVVPSSSPDFLDGNESVCEYAFSNCTSLVSVMLPLGVIELPEGLFVDCSSLVDFEMPYTVETIADNAFFGCTALTALTVTENVTEIGANVFSGCSKLKVVRYLGDEPESVASSIYQAANRALVSGYLKGLRSWPSAGEGEEAEPIDVGATNEASVVTASVVSVTWPSGEDGRLLMAWKTEKYSFKKVTLDYNIGDPRANENLFYVTGRVIGELPDPTVEAGDFLGWFTARSGGEEVDPYTPVTAAMTVYAHWDVADDGSGRGAVEVFEPFYGEDDAGFAFTAATFEGLLMSEGKVAGTISVKTQKGAYSSAAGGTNSAFTAAMQVLGVKKTSLKGVVEADGTASVENEKNGLALELEFTQFGFSGTYSTEDGDYEIVGARDRYSAGSDAAKNLVRVALANAKGTWSVALPVESADGDGAALAQGYAGLSVTIGAKGKSRVAGTMPDGTRVAVSSTLIAGDGCACLPVVVPLYAGKSGGFAFALWFTWAADGSESQMSVAGLSAWDATTSKAAPFEATFGEPIVGAVSSGAMTGTKTFVMDNFFDELGAEDGFSPNGTEIEISGTRWKVPRADGVRFSKDDGWYVADDREYGNPAGLKLTYSAKAGTFKGSFKVFAETDEGRSKKYTATVTGVVVGGEGYGTATIKKVGSVPMKVE